MYKCVIFDLIYTMSFIALVKGLGAPGEKTWNYEIKSISTKSSDTGLMDINLTNERVSRGIYAISGEINMNIDIVDGDGNMVSAKSYRSANSDGEYSTLPFQVATSHWHKVLNSYYKDVLMDTLKECSDMPAFEGDFVPPFEKKVYTLTKCKFSQDGLPNHMQAGTYKLVIGGTGDVEWEIELIAEIESTL